MKILLTSGGSLHSETAIWFGAQLAAFGDKPPTILTVIPNETMADHAREVLARASKICASAAGNAESDRQWQLTEANTKIRVGKTDEEILREITEGSYDLLVLGERQVHRLKARLTGSVTEHVMRHVPCSILIAKGKVEPIDRILICDSGYGPNTVLQRLVASGLVKLLRGKVQATVLHVMSQISAAPGVPDAQLLATAEELIQSRSPEGLVLERDLELLSQQNAQAKARVRHGLVLDEILAEAQEGNYDLVIIGAHRGAGWQRFLLDDIAHQVSTQIDRPILILH